MSSTEATPAGPRRDFLFALLLVGLVGFAPTLFQFHVIWTAQPYTHGYLVAAATGWLLYRERAALAHLDPWAPLPAIVAIGLALLWLLGSIMGVRVATLVALPGLVVAWALSVFGRRSISTLIPIGLTFLIAVPIWEGLVGPLRSLTIAINSILVGLLGIPAEIEGSMVHITRGTFVIEDDCSGFAFFMSGLAVGGLYAVAFVRRSPTRLAIIATALALAMLGNWIRVTSLIVIGHVTEMEAEVIYDHGGYGWMIFFALLVLFFPIARWLEGWGGARWPEPTPTAETGRERAAPPLRPVVLATAPMVVAPAILLSFTILPDRDVPAASITTSFETSAERPYEWRPGFVGADSSFEGRAASDPSVHLDHVIYESQRPDAELIGFYNEIAPDSVLFASRLIGPVPGSVPYVNESVVREGEQVVLVWYWYRVGGIETASEAKAKLLEVPAFLTAKRQAELIAVSTMCEPAGCEDAAGRLQTLLSEH